MKPYTKERYEQLKEQYDLVVTSNGGVLEDSIIRVGHLGNMEWKDCEVLLEAMEQVWEKL